MPDQDPTRDPLLEARPLAHASDPGDTATITYARGETQPPNWAWLPYLVFRPVKFARHFAADTGRLLLGLSIWIVGMGRVIDRFFSNELQGRSIGPFTDWAAAWALIIVLGIIGGGLSYLVGGAIYSARLWLAGARNIDHVLARRTNCFAALLPMLILLIDACAATLLYDSVLTYVRSEQPLDLVITVSLFWSVWISYRMATTLFEPGRLGAVFWFLIAPSVFYLLIFTTAFWVYWFAPPIAGTPRTYDDGILKFDRPLNWDATANASDTGAASVSVVGTGGAGANLMIYPSMQSAEAELRASVENWSAMASDVSIEGDFDSWAGRSGVGRRLRLTLPEGEYELRLFVARVADFARLEIQEYYRPGRYDDQRRGFQLIQDSISYRLGRVGWFPEIERPNAHADERIRFQFPADWNMINDPNSGAGTVFIRAAYGAFASFDAYEPTTTPQGELHAALKFAVQWAGADPNDLSITPMTWPAWEGFNGVAADAAVEIDAIRWRFEAATMFITEDLAIDYVQAYPESVGQTLKAGFELIRSTLRIEPPDTQEPTTQPSD